MSRDANFALDRRTAIGSMLTLAALAHPLSSNLLAAVQTQPLISQVRRLVEAMAYLGEPFNGLEAGTNGSELRLDRPATLLSSDRIGE